MNTHLNLDQEQSEINDSSQKQQSQIDQNEVNLDSSDLLQNLRNLSQQQDIVQQKENLNSYKNSIDYDNDSQEQNDENQFQDDDDDQEIQIKVNIDESKSRSRSKSQEKKKYCCSLCQPSKSHKACPCTIPAKDRKQKLGSTGCKNCGCQGCGESQSQDHQDHLNKKKQRQPFKADDPEKYYKYNNLINTRLSIYIQQSTGQVPFLQGLGVPERTSRYITGRPSVKRFY